MKNSTILFASAMMLSAAAVSAQTQSIHKRLHSSIYGVSASKVMMAQDMNPRTIKQENKNFRTAEKSNFMPLTEMVYTYTEDGTWELEGEYSYTYKNGKVATQTQKSGDDITLTTTSYSDDGLTETVVESTSSDGGKNFTNASKAVFVHDPVVADLVISKKRYEWDSESNDWTEISDSFQRDIKRDADGNITSLTILVPYMGAYDATEKYTNTVDPETKQINSFKYESLTYDENDQPVWQTNQYLTDIKWEKTNGQLVSQYDEWMLWDNYLSSATLAYEEDGETKSFGNINIEYSGDGGYNETFQYTDQLERTDTKKVMADENGSFSIEEKSYSDANEDGVLTDEDLVSWNKEIVTYDAHKNLAEDEFYELDEETSGLVKTMGEKTERQYDAEHGDAVKETITSSYDMDAQEYMPYSKVIVTSFTDVTSGIKAVENTDGNIAAYNLQGMRIDASASNGMGITIVKKSGKAFKVIK